MKLTQTQNDILIIIALKSISLLIQMTSQVSYLFTLMCVCVCVCVCVEGGGRGRRMRERGGYPNITCNGIQINYM